MKQILFFAFAFLFTTCAAEELPAPYNPPTPVIDHAPTIFDIEIESPASPAFYPGNMRTIWHHQSE